MFIIHRRFSIRQALLVLFLPLLLLADQSFAQTQQSEKAKTSLLILGDSLSAAYGLQTHNGWVSLLQKRWADEALQIEIINAAISGDTTDGGLSRLPGLLEQHSPTHVLIELGGNDGLQGHSITKMKKNLNNMIDLAQASGATVFLQDMEIPPNYGKRYTSMFADAFDDVAQNQEVPLIPFFLESVALDRSLMQRDGIHPNKQAQPLIAEFMDTKLRPLVE
ncbi:arylesterase [Salinimonas sp. HHU 13199]|uniref:Arylesterase n=1 Tax=Salinimonas profundi TaxID=2729140 RepID=A0ABR8LH68_9ALTE|nr:arylesterase [Salinimonas profundi]MBD3585067.1 arylesterase [Salinimonas profundi]